MCFYKFSNFPFVVDFQFHAIVVRENTWYGFNIPEFSKTSFWPSIWSILENAPYDLRRMYILLLLNRTSCVCPLGTFGLQFYSDLLFPYRFCLNNLSNVESDVFKYPTIITLLFISLLSSFTFCYMCLGAPMLGAYILTILISWCIFPFFSI